MPYLKQMDRARIITALEPLKGVLRTRGEYNYAITSLLHQFIGENGLCYGTLNDAVGIVECTKQELLRVVVAPYEDAKAKENQPVSRLDAEFFTNQTPSHFESI